jgi:hypothetical protein
MLGGTRAAGLRRAAGGIVTALLRKTSLPFSCPD